MNGVVYYPASKHVRETNEECEKLSEYKKDIFHSVASRLILITKIDRPVIEPAVAYLCTHASKRNKYDWKILRILVTFIKTSSMISE